MPPMPNHRFAGSGESGVADNDDAPLICRREDSAEVKIF